MAAFPMRGSGRRSGGSDFCDRETGGQTVPSLNLPFHRGRTLALGGTELVFENQLRIIEQTCLKTPFA